MSTFSTLVGHRDHETQLGWNTILLNIHNLHNLMYMYGLSKFQFCGPITFGATPLQVTVKGQSVCPATIKETYRHF